MALFSKVFSCLSKSRVTIRRCYSGISCPPPSPPGLAIEELKNRHGFGPWLMFADAENDKRDSASGGFRRCYSFSSGEIFSLPAPQLQRRRCWGTQYGWLITFGPHGVVRLFNPLTHRQLPLPSRSTLPPYRFCPAFLPPFRRRSAFFQKFSLSSDSNTLVVMSTYGYFLDFAFSSPGDKAWKYTENQLTDIDDTIFYKGQFYSTNSLGDLRVCDITSGESKEKPINTTYGLPINRLGMRRVGAKGHFDRFYLVEISGHLHLICRSCVYCRPFRTKNVRVKNKRIRTKSFDIYRFDFGENEWISIEDLSGHTVFVGNNPAFAISATDYPEIKPNCIYFTDDSEQNYKYQFCDTGVYDFATKKKRKIGISFYKGHKSPFSKYSRPFFFIPSLSDL